MNGPAEATVAELVVERPARARVFERLGLDYCCGGGRTLRAACEAHGLDVDAVVAELDEARERDGGCDVASLSDAELCEHVVTVHHAYLREELPRLSGLLDRVLRAHGGHDGRLALVHAAFTELRSELELHAHEEETELFPAIVAGEDAALDGFEDEHERAGRLLALLSTLTDGYDVEQARCGTHRQTLTALAELQDDLHRHIHEENNVLFARARG